MIMIKYFIFSFTSSVSESAFLTKSLVSVVLILLTFSTNSSYLFLLTISFFITTFSLLKLIGAVSYLPISKLSTFTFQIALTTSYFF